MKKKISTIVLLVLLLSVVSAEPLSEATSSISTTIEDTSDPSPSGGGGGGGGSSSDNDYPGCNDGIDNDGDGLIDYPDDPGCTSRYDVSEVTTLNNPGDVCVNETKVCVDGLKVVTKECIHGDLVSTNKSCETEYCTKDKIQKCWDDTIITVTKCGDNYEFIETGEVCPETECSEPLKETCNGKEIVVKDCVEGYFVDTGNKCEKKGPIIAGQIIFAIFVLYYIYYTNKRREEENKIREEQDKIQRHEEMQETDRLY